MKLKKILLIGGIATLGLALVGGFGAVKKQISYARQHIQEMLDEHTDPEQEIKRLKGEVSKLDAEENGIKNDYAKEIYAVEKMKKQAESLKAAVEGEKAAVLAFAESIKEAEGANKKVSVGKTSIDVADAKKKLVADRNAVVKREKTLADLETVLRVREEAKGVLFAQMIEIQTIRTDLTNELEGLETEYKSLKLQAMKNKYHRDDSKLSEVREGIEKLKDKIAEKRIRVGLDNGKGKPDAPVTESVDEIIAPLSGK